MAGARRREPELRRQRPVRPLPDRRRHADALDRPLELATARRSSSPARRPPLGTRPVFPGKRPPYRPDVAVPHAEDPGPQLGARSARPTAARARRPAARGGARPGPTGRRTPLTPPIAVGRSRRPAGAARATRRAATPWPASSLEPPQPVPRPRPRRGEATPMKRAIRKHLRDFAAIIVPVPRSRSGVGGYILSNQRFYLPGVGAGRSARTSSTINAEFQTAKSVTPGQGQTVDDRRRQRRRDLEGRARRRPRASSTMKIRQKYAERIHKRRHDAAAPEDRPRGHDRSS